MEVFLTQSDGVAVSFTEASAVKDHWRTSLHVGGLVTLVAGVQYMYMCVLGSDPQVPRGVSYRYIDWSITVPLQMMHLI